MTTTAPYPARWWHALEDGRIQCDLCPRDCKLQEDQRGACFVRQRQGDQMVLTTYGRSSGFCVDPIEKKPLNHFYPGSSVLSFGTAGCNLFCQFCQNWDISKSKQMDTLMDQANPEAIAAAATQNHCKSVAFTYNDPVIFAEYAIDTAQACREAGVKTVAVTAGYIHEQPRKEFFATLDAVNMDLKSFSDDFYRKITGSSLQPVLDSLIYIKQETQAWLEITTLLIPGLNDSESELHQLSQWVMENLGPDVPLHFSAFHPDFRMLDKQGTSLATLTQARDIALQTGLHFVYTGNVHHAAGDATHCSGCKKILIQRDWYAINDYHLDPEGNCPDCGTPLPGRFSEQAGQFGRHRLPVRIHDFA